ncbi:MAG: hypothetical protein P0119_20700 [Nitrospira sp.]|nr:hypothetical protein [Nitrospira sp.]
MASPIVFVALAAVLAFASLGGGLYEYLVIDPFWPRRPDLVQPQRGGINRKRFWIPAHTTFELLLIVALIVVWNESTVRTPLLIALAGHAAMRIWSAFDFIPQALAFERMDPAAIEADAARSWTRRSRGRLPLDLVVCGAMLTALVSVARLG